MTAREESCTEMAERPRVIDMQSIRVDKRVLALFRKGNMEGLADIAIDALKCMSALAQLVGDEEQQKALKEAQDRVFDATGEWWK